MPNLLESVRKIRRGKRISDFSFDCELEDVYICIYIRTVSTSILSSTSLKDRTSFEFVANVDRKIGRDEIFGIGRTKIFSSGLPFFLFLLFLPLFSSFHPSFFLTINETE